MSDQFDPYSYAASSGQQAPPAKFDPYEYASSTASNPNYVPPTIGGGNTWGDVALGLPQAIESGFNRGVLDIAGIPMDAATNVANLGKAGIGYVESKLTGKAPPAWTMPTDPSEVPGTSAWLNKEAAKPFGGSIVNVTAAPQSYLAQGASALTEQLGPTVAGTDLTARPPIEGEFTPVEGSEMTRNPQSLSAAAASPNLQAASLELRQAVSTAVQNGEPVNADVLNRHIQAESLPVPARLTKGQATQDPVLLSQEQNQRGLSGGVFSKHFNQQNQNLIENMQTMRDEIGPDVHTTNQVEHGEALMKAYQAKDAQAEADVSAKYKALKDANGGQFPVDAKTLKSNVDTALHQQLLYEHAPSAEMRQLEQMSQKGMTFEQYEAMRTNLARIMRSSSDGNEKAAAGIIRQQMENLPLTGGAANLKPLADAARAAAKARFDAIGEDPAYRAVVNGSVAPDAFVRRFIVNGNRDDISLMRKNLAGDDVAQQTISTSAFEHLRKSARLDDEFRGNFAAQSYNNALQAMGPKARTLFSPKQIEDLSNIGDVARYETAQPRGSYVNNSNTAVTQLAEHGKSLAEQAVNAKTLGIGGTVARKFLKGRAERALAKEHLAPGAGITWQPSGATP